MKVVLDTNVLLVSISRRSRYHPIFEAFENKRYQLLVTTDILLEYEETISFHMGAETADNALKRLQAAALHKENIFEALMETAKICSLGQITNALYEVGGHYRRNM